MRAVVQRVSAASVSVEGTVVGEIGIGFAILLGVMDDDGPEQSEYLARKIAGLRVFEDDIGRMNLGLDTVGGEALVISQFTLCADVRKGRRPSFTDAAAPETAQALYEKFCHSLADTGIRVAKGVFQAHMEVSLVNDGPVTLWLDTAELMPG